MLIIKDSPPHADSRSSEMHVIIAAEMSVHIAKMVGVYSLFFYDPEVCPEEEFSRLFQAIMYVDNAMDPAVKESRTHLNLGTHRVRFSLSAVPPWHQARANELLQGLGAVVNPDEQALLIDDIDNLAWPVFDCEIGVNQPAHHP